jgi:hypothetical protein
LTFGQLPQNRSPGSGQPEADVEAAVVATIRPGSIAPAIVTAKTRRARGRVIGEASDRASSSRKSLMARC